MYARRLLINKVHNMRELGGYSTADGGMTAWKRFIRSDAPVGLDANDVRFLYDYGVRTVIDLRQADEARYMPSSLENAQGITYRNISFTEDFSLMGSADYCPRDHLVPVMRGEHRTAEILKAMADAEGAVLFYCFAGKDRTGILSALLLMLAGVPTVDVLADYMVTYTYIQSKLAMANKDAGTDNYFVANNIRKGTRPEHLRRTEPEWLLPFIGYIEEHGGAASYMSSIGLTPAEISKLRKRLLI
jgi:protein-tyrosine phosphatase